MHVLWARALARSWNRAIRLNVSRASRHFALSRN
jgi:hypothetical protein